MGFHWGRIPSYFSDHHMVSFQAGAVSSSNMLFPSTIDAIDTMDGMDSVAYPAISRGNNLSLASPSVGAHHLDPIPGLKHDTGLAIDWSSEEQTSLERGLAMYSNETNIMKYVKIAASLHGKTVRDVALRCRWMTNKENVKRRKQEECYIGKKIKDRKEKQVDCSSTVNTISNQAPSVPPCSFTMPHAESSSCIAHEVSGVDGATEMLLEETARLLLLIGSNLSTLKLQDNVDLFFHAKNYVTAILKRMHERPGIMSRMPPLPVTIDENLLETLCATQALTFCTPGGGVHLKQEPRC